MPVTPNEPIKVNSADGCAHKGCAICRSTTGPFTYAGTEVYDFGAVYLCASCVRLHARALGLVGGDEQAGLLHAREREAKLEQQVKRMTERRKKELEKEAELEKQVEELDEALSWHRERVVQLEARVRESAESDLALVTKP